LVGGTGFEPVTPAV